MYCIAVFRSRTQVLEFIDGMRRNGISCSAVNTPSEAHVGCGISAKFSVPYLKKAEDYIFRNMPHSFRGIYLIDRSVGQIRKIR